MERMGWVGGVFWVGGCEGRLRDFGKRYIFTFSKKDQNSLQAFVPP